MGQRSMRTWKFIAAAGALLASSVSCGDVVRTGRAPVMLIIQSLTASPTGGFGANQFSGTLHSDVIVMITTPAPCTTATPCPTVYADLGQAILSLVPKDIGTTASPATPSSNNQVTINRVHIAYVRADGHNVQGVDVPYEFDGAVTGTVPPTGTVTLSFELVRHIAKEEPPLVGLIGTGQIITTIAQVTFYGTDAVGNAVSVMGQIQVDFGNFGDQ